MSFKKILVAVDNEPLSAHSADVAAELAQSLGAQLGLITVLDTGIPDHPPHLFASEELLAASREEGSQLLARLCQRSKLQPAPVTFMPAGKPATEIVRTAAEWGADLLVVGCHGLGGVERFLVGSVADGVIRHAPCPVLVVRFTR